MSKRRIAVPALVALAAFAAPAAASAATLTPDKACYGDGDIIGLGGSGYTPSSSVTLSVDTRAFSQPVATTPTGVIAPKILLTSLVQGRTQTSVLRATDNANPANFGQTNITRARLRVTVSPANASPRSVRRFRARGFTAGSTLYRHITRNGAVSNGRMGKLKGSCKTLSVKKRLFRKTAKSGTYRVQFDTKRKYSSKTVQRVRFRVKVYRIVRRSSAASAATATTGETWTQLP